jgi:hypothetical protein
MTEQKHDRIFLQVCDVNEEAAFAEDERRRIANLQKTAPKAIWLQIDQEAEQFDGWDAQTWCGGPINDTDVEYIRADIMAEQLAELLKESNQQLAVKSGALLAACEDLEKLEQQLAAKDAAIKISLDTLKFILRYGVLDKSQMVREAIAAIDKELGK